MSLEVLQTRVSFVTTLILNRERERERERDKSNLDSLRINLSIIDYAI